MLIKFKKKKIATDPTPFKERLDELRKDTPKNRRRALELLNERYFSIGVGSDYVVCDEHATDSSVLPMQEDEFKKRYRPYLYTPKDGGRAKPLGSLWLEWLDHRRFDGQLVFKPTGARVERDRDDFNTWRGFRVQPTPGDWSLFRGHLRDIVCRGNEDYFNYLLDYFAHMVQFPGRLPGVAIVLNGPQGTGKTIVYRMLERLFHPYNTILVEDPRRVTDKFNWHLADKILVCADEAIFARDPNVPGILKSRITSENLTFERKHIDSVKLDNFTRLLIMSNDDHVIHVDPDERRYFVLRIDERFAQKPGESLAEATARRRPYFDPISEQMLHGGGLAAMMHEFMTRPNIAAFDARAALRDTPWLDEQKEYSLKPHHKWISARLAQGHWWFNEPEQWPSKKAVLDDYRTEAPQYNKRDPLLTPQHLGRELAKIFGAGVGSHKQTQTRPGGQKVLVEVYTFPPLAEARTLWNAFLGRRPTIRVKRKKHTVS